MKNIDELWQIFSKGAPLTDEEVSLSNPPVFGVGSLAYLSRKRKREAYDDEEEKVPSTAGYSRLGQCCFGVSSGRDGTHRDCPCGSGDVFQESYVETPGRSHLHSLSPLFLPRRRLLEGNYLNYVSQHML